MRIEKTKKEILEKNAPFKLNDNFGDPNAESLIFYGGKIPIIVTAPHSVKTYKTDKATGEIEIKPNEMYIGAIALILHETIGCHVMVRNNNNESNLEDNFYNQRLIEYINDLGILYHADLIGVKKDSPYDIGIGTGNGKYVEQIPHFTEIVFKSFEMFGITNLSFNTKLQGINKATLSRQVFDKCGISTTQLTIAKELRTTNDIAKMNALLSGLATYLEGINEEINFGKIYRY